MAQSTAYKAIKKNVDEQGRERPGKKAAKTDLSAHSVGKDNWILESPEGLAALDRGLADAAAGRVVMRRSYVEYADITILAIG